MKKGWKIKKLGDICSIYDSQRKPVTKKNRNSGEYPYYGASGIQDYVDKYIFDGRFLLVGEDGAKWGKWDKSSYIIDGKSWVNNHVHILKLSSEVIDYFVNYYLIYSDLQKYITGAIVPKLTQAALVSIPLPIPPLSEQKEIVAELDLLNKIIEDKRQQITELDNLAQATFYDMFGDPVTNEKGWKICKLGELFNITSSKRVFQSEWRKKGVPFYRAREIVKLAQNGYVDNELFIDDRMYAEYAKKYGIPHTNDIMITGVGTLGVCYVVKNTDKFYFKDGNIIWLQYLGKANPIYILYAFKTPYIKHQVNNCAAAVVGTYTIVRANNTMITLPPLDLQAKFASKIEAIDHQKQLINQSIAETQKLLDYTMDKYFG